jgi:DcmR-like sensory protein
MDTSVRHQCYIYDGSPSTGLSAMAGAIKRHLHDGYRCIYLNSLPMVAGMRSYLAAIGVDVVGEAAKMSLVLSSDQRHLVNGRFEVEPMLEMLSETAAQALRDGYKGVWAAGDMTWELGPQHDFAKLLEYEWRLEDLMRKQPAIRGICQYHAGTMPREAVRDALVTHNSIYINETLSRVNPHFIRTKTFADLAAAHRPDLDDVIAELCSSPSAD